MYWYIQFTKTSRCTSIDYKIVRCALWGRHPHINCDRAYPGYTAISWFSLFSQESFDRYSFEGSMGISLYNSPLILTYLLYFPWLVRPSEGCFEMALLRVSVRKTWSKPCIIPRSPRLFNVYLLHVTLNNFSSRTRGKAVLWFHRDPCNSNRPSTRSKMWNWKLRLLDIDQSSVMQYN